MTTTEHVDPIVTPMDTGNGVAAADLVDYDLGENDLGGALVFALLAGLSIVLAVFSPVAVVSAVALAIVVMAGAIAFRLTRRGGGSR
ncbi:hypothetical protein F0L68_39755 [Solihabitans fulvus]|uniref:Uncharacterized protein n=1 Tax=Solihabitans fulvus TaxID=1892852 RepID=A0A5B2WED0_9PSEU|nr:hypothetical protein [Solihabitans fulvus]KAA2248687.1 hypothetical protein F0L68_39755 [Solihabitans fulvus]